MKFIIIIISFLIINSNAENERQAKFGFLGTSTSALTKLAQDLVTRSTSSSQVLSLNLTNLVILLVVKALIFGAGSLGFGGTGGIGRSAEENSIEHQDPFMSESDLILMLSYLKADSTQKYGCVHRLACEDPKKAKEYLTAGKFLLQTSRLLNLSSEGAKYEGLLKDMQDAVAYGQNGNDCSIRYTCE